MCILLYKQKEIMGRKWTDRTKQNKIKIHTQHTLSHAYNNTIADEIIHSRLVKYIWIKIYFFNKSLFVRFLWEQSGTYSSKETGFNIFSGGGLLLLFQHWVVLQILTIKILNL